MVGAAFEDFFRAEWPAVVRNLTVALGDRALAEEAAQYAFVEAFAHWRKVRKMERAAGWVYVASIRYARRRRPAVVDDVPDRVVDDHAIFVTNVDEIGQLLDLLPPRQRLALVLRYLSDLSVDEVATAMGCAPGTVKATVHAALERVRTERIVIESRDRDAD
jgi:RNA polymerase sigma factor (sigma-70 family)